MTQVPQKAKRATTSAGRTGLYIGPARQFSDLSLVEKFRVFQAMYRVRDSWPRPGSVPHLSNIEFYVAGEWLLARRGY